MGIKEFYFSLETKEKTKFIKEVIDRCDISYPSFMLKVRNDKWTKLEREAVENIIKSKGNGGTQS